MEPRSGGGHNVLMSQQPNYAGPIGGADMGGYTYRNAPGDWSQFFGPSKGPIETAPYGSYRRENFALPDAYQGSNSFLTNVIITLVTEQVSRSPPTHWCSARRRLRAAPAPLVMLHDAQTPARRQRPTPHDTRTPVRTCMHPHAPRRDGTHPLHRTCGPSRWRCPGA